MKLKMLVSMAGADFALSPGDVTERFSAAEAGRLVAAGYAVHVGGIASAPQTPAMVQQTDDVIPHAVIERAVKKPAKERRG